MSDLRYPPIPTETDLTFVSDGHKDRFMTEDRTYIRKEVIALTGVPNDALTFWLRSYVIRPFQGHERAKMRLRFSRADVRIVAVLNHARGIGLNIDALRAIADTLYDSEQWIAENGVTADDRDALWEERDRRYYTPEVQAEMLEYARSRNYFDEVEKLKESIVEMRDRVVPERIMRAVDSLCKKSGNLADIILGILEEEGTLTLFRDGDENWVVKDVPNLDSGLPAATCVLLDLTKIFSSIEWNQA